MKTFWKCWWFWLILALLIILVSHWRIKQYFVQSVRNPEIHGRIFSCGKEFLKFRPRYFLFILNNPRHTGIMKITQAWSSCVSMIVIISDSPFQTIILFLDYHFVHLLLLLCRNMCSNLVSHHTLNLSSRYRFENKECSGFKCTDPLAPICIYRHVKWRVMMVNE